MQTRSVLAATFGLAFVGGIYACQDTFSNPLSVYNPDSGPPLTFDANFPQTDSSVPDAEADASTVDAHDAASSPDTGLLLNGCGEADFADADRSALDAARVILFSYDGSPIMYDPQCLRIATGESVTWEGNFFDHPMGPFNGGPNNPIPFVSDGGPDSSFTVHFPEAGVFGYQCQVHVSMYGAVEVR